MNWSLLLPSTWNPLSAFSNLFNQNSQIASQALSDTFILATICLALFFGLWAAKLTRDSLVTTGRYLSLLRQDQDALNAITSSDLSLFRELQHHLLKISTRDGSGRMLVRRTVDASEIFRKSKLAPSFSSNRLFLAVPTILTGLGVLGTFVGLQIGIGGLDLNNLKNLEKSIVPLIQGCAIAFSTSVWGVLASLVFSGLEKGFEGVAVGKIHKLQNRVDSLVARFVPEKAMAELERTSRGTEEILKGLAVAIGDEMQKAIGRLGREVKEAVANATSESHGPLMEKSAELLANALTSELVKLKEQIGSMAEQFSNQFSSSSGDLMKSVQAFQPTVETLSKSVDDVQKTVMNAVSRLSAHDLVVTKMNTAAEDLRKAADAFAEMKETLQVASENNRKAADAQLSAAATNEQVAEKFDRVGERLPEVRQTVEDAARVIASISGPIANLKTYLEDLPNNQNEYEQKRAISEDERNKRLIEMTGDLAEKVGNAAAHFSKVGDMAERLAAAAVSLDDASNELATFGNHVVTASKEQRRAAEAAQAAALSGERTSKELALLPEAIETSAEGLNIAGESIKLGAEAARDSYRELVVLQKQWFAGAESGLNAMKDRLHQIIKAYGEQIEGQTRNLMNQWTKEVAECLKTYDTQVESIQDGLEEFQTALSRMKRN